MAYALTDWKNREVEKPRTFQLQNNPDATVTLLPKEGNVIEAGTPIIADNMNKIEQGIKDAHDGLAGIGDVSQELATHMADDTSHVRYGVATGVNPKVVTLNPAPAALIEGMALSFKNTTANTAAATLNVNGLGAKPIVKSNGGALTSGNLKAGSIYTVRYSGTSFILQGEGGEYGTAEAAQVRKGYTVGRESGIETGTFTGGIESRQTGYAAIDNGQTSVLLNIASVDLSRSIVRLQVEAFSSGGANSADYLLLMAEFSNNSRISVRRRAFGNYSSYFRWEVLTFYDVKSIQTFYSSLPAGTKTINQDIVPVNLNKTMLFHSAVPSSADPSTSYPRATTFAYLSLANRIQFGTVEAHTESKSFCTYVVEFE